MSNNPGFENINFIFGNLLVMVKFILRMKH